MMRLQEDSRVSGEHVRILQSQQLTGLDGVLHGFSTRTGGVSEGEWASLNLGHGLGDDPSRVEENRRLLVQAAGLQGQGIFELQQVHGTNVVQVFSEHEPHEVALTEGDALVTHVPGRVLAVRTADCVPILLVDPKAPAIAVVHAGWRSTAAGVVRAAVSRMVGSLGARTGRMFAALGPAIGSCCFEVGDDAADQLRAVHDGCVTRRAGRLFGDLAAANEAFLREAGIDESRIERVGGCTNCEELLFFSHRRDAGITGRHLSYVCLRPTP